jgi:hypothetical protein
MARRSTRPRGSGGHPLEHGRVAGVRRRRPLGVGEVEATAPMQQEVRLLRAVAPEIERPATVATHLPAADLGEDQRFPQSADEG